MQILKKKQKVCSAVKLYMHYVSINVRCMMQYKISFFLSSMGQFLVSFNVFLGIYLYNENEER